MKINKIGYVILGAILYFIASNLFKDKIHAKTNNDPSLHIIESKPISKLKKWRAISNTGEKS